MYKSGTQQVTVGSRVQVLNQSLDGHEFIEGYAVIVGMEGESMFQRKYCAVQFSDGTIVYRWINPDIYTE